MITELDFFVGIDLATDTHQVCVVDKTGKMIGELTFEHSGSGLHEFIRSLEKLSGREPAPDVFQSSEEPQRGLEPLRMP